MEVDLKFNGSSITRTDKKDYLGLTLDEGLKWDKHIDKLRKKLSSAIYSIKLAKFLPRDSLLTLYHSLVESRLRYCCAVWGNCGDTLKTSKASKQGCPDRFGKLFGSRTRKNSPRVKSAERTTTH